MYTHKTLGKEHCIFFKIRKSKDKTKAVYCFNIYIATDTASNSLTLEHKIYHSYTYVRNMTLYNKNIPIHNRSSVRQVIQNISITLNFSFHMVHDGFRSCARGRQ